VKTTGGAGGSNSVKATGGAGGGNSVKPTGGAGGGNSGAAAGGSTMSSETADGSAGDTASYALPPPNPCSNQFSNQNCRKGVASSACAGVCTNDYGGTAANVCAGGSSGVPVNYACPSWMLYSDEMNEAASADGFGGQLNYGVAGHDVDNASAGIDNGLTDACCQCYQLVFDYPAENQTWVDPNSSSNPQSAITPPLPMVVQSFNTATNGKGDFDIYMGGGGFGANNGCFVAGGNCPGGPCMYSAYPTQDGGEVKAVGNSLNSLSPNPCKNQTQWVTEATLTSSACAAAVADMCGEIVSTNAPITTQTVRSCVQSNGVTQDATGQIPGDYHVNWNIWVKRVECPSHMTEVTGCKLASQGLPGPDATINTVAKAQAAGFLQKASDGTNCSTTQMQDCCMPTCSWQNNVSGATVSGYNSFYSCDQNGVPWTTAVTRTN
jgi:hypothetical protein